MESKSKYQFRQRMYNDSIFITYANFPIQRFPEAFTLVMKEWEKDAFWDNCPEYVREVIPVLLSDIEKVKKAFGIQLTDELKKILEKRIWGNLLGMITTSFDTSMSLPQEVLLDLYGHEILKCQEPFVRGFLGCGWGKIRKKLFPTRNLKCFQCDYKYFSYVLESIIGGVELSNIPGMDLLIESYGRQSQFWRIEKNTSPPKEKIRSIEITSFGGGYWSFPKCLSGAITQSLVEFLIYKDRRRLKKCPICRNYFIAEKDIKRKFCPLPKNCEWVATKNRQRELMRKKRDKRGSGFDVRYI
jgi:hypothetical protein